MGSSLCVFRLTRLWECFNGTGPILIICYLWPVSEVLSNTLVGLPLFYFLPWRTEGGQTSRGKMKNEKNQWPSFTESSCDIKQDVRTRQIECFPDVLKLFHISLWERAHRATDGGSLLVTALRQAVKLKTYFPLRKAVCAVICSSFHVKILSSSD